MHRLKCPSILELRSPDEWIQKWTSALTHCVQHRGWSSEMRQSLESYRRAAMSLGYLDSTIFPTSPKMCGTFNMCVVHYVAYWAGKFNFLLRQWTQTGKYSPRAWNLLSKPIGVLNDVGRGGFLNVIIRENNGTRYVVNLG